MNHSARHLLLGATLVAGTAATAAAQPEVTEYDPNAPVFGPATPPPTPQAPTIITIGPDGKPMAPPSTGPGGVVHYDDMQLYAEESEVEVHGGPTPELHVVRRGDTLWDICWYYFNDPWQWPKVWSYNAQITNPHWIYPGDLVRLLPKGFLAGPAITDPGLEPETDPGTKPTDAATPQRRLDVSVRQVAFIDKKHLESSLYIIGAVEDKELLATGDEVYVSYPDGAVPKVAERYSIYAEDQAVTHPDGGKNVGSYVRIQGELEIVSVKQGKRARARITSANNEIERGSRVGPLLRQFKSVPPARNEVDVQGTIVAMLASDQLIGQGEVIFMDLGKGAGIKPGNRLFVVRRGDAFDAQTRPQDQPGQDDRTFPARALGEVVLVQVGDTISVGLVTLSLEEMGVGDLVMMRKQ
jgi:hypothetical protein